MRHLIAPLAATAAGIALALAASGAAAGGPGSGSSGGSSSNCGCLPSSHQVTVPGVTVVPPTTYIAQPAFYSGVGGGSEGNLGIGSQSNLGVDVSTSSTSSTTASGQASAASLANAQAANLLAATTSASGSGGGYVESGGGVGGSITNLTVVTPGAAPATGPQQCVAHASVASSVAIQAVCLDDKAVPHPASQLFPDRDVVAGYEGELFRCVAGSHMQYVTARWSGAAEFDHGQTTVCQKGEALWRTAEGRLQCRPQKPARDCNERSLLRRFGAGIKVVRMAADACTAYGPGPAVVAQSTASSGGDFAMDGGVGR